jgi:antitoxin (DNA-binding transcriptional repressor) of toxin-antitoxin stability system
MRSVGLKVLKNKLSEYVRLAAGGETVLVTDRDRIVAEIGPPRSDRNPLLDDPFYARGVGEGWLTLPTVPPTAPLPPRKPVASLNELMRELADDREDRG